jgi:hypothetical protein
VKSSLVRLTYGDGLTEGESTELLMLQVPVMRDDNQRLGVVQATALRRALTLIDDEMKRLLALSDQIRG